MSEETLVGLVTQSANEITRRIEAIAADPSEAFQGGAAHAASVAGRGAFGHYQPRSAVVAIERAVRAGNLEAARDLEGRYTQFVHSLRDEELPQGLLRVNPVVPDDVENLGVALGLEHEAAGAGEGRRAPVQVPEILGRPIWSGKTPSGF